MEKKHSTYKYKICSCGHVKFSHRDGFETRYKRPILHRIFDSMDCIFAYECKKCNCVQFIHMTTKTYDRVDRKYID